MNKKKTPTQGEGRKTKMRMRLDRPVGLSVSPAFEFGELFWFEVHSQREAEFSENFFDLVEGLLTEAHK